MKRLAMYAVPIIIACFIVCGSAGPRVFLGDAVGGHETGCACDGQNDRSFCGHAPNQTCPSGSFHGACQGSSGTGTCATSGSPCPTTVCVQAREEQCSGY